MKGNSFGVSTPVMRASIAAACAMAQGEGSGGQDKALRRLWVSQAGWEAGSPAFGNILLSGKGPSRVVTVQEIRAEAAGVVVGIS